MITVDYVVREFEMQDAPMICQLNREVLGYDYPEQETVRKLQALLESPRDRIYVADKDGAVIGYVHAADYDVIYAPHMKNIMGIAVSGGHQKQGVGKALLAAVEQWAKGTGAVGIRLVSGESRTGAHAFYRRCGYDGGKKQVNFKKML